MSTIKKYERRPYQEKIVSRCLETFDRGKKSVLIVSPTGSGKTVMGLSIAKALQERTGPLTVGWVSMRKEILDQAKAENENMGFNLRLRTISQLDKNPPKVDFLVVDEAHHDATASMGNIHDKTKAKSVIGLTATAFRADRASLLFEETIKDVSYQSLVDDGYLSQYDHFTVRSWTPQTVADTYCADPKRWGKSVVFFHSEAQCLEVIQLLAKRGIRAEQVNSKTTNRSKVIEGFRAGDFPVLVNMLILTEGFDCSSLQTVWLRPSVKGCTIQMGGRVLRTHRDLPVKSVVQCLKTPYPFPKLIKPREQYIDENGSGNWLSVRPTRKLDQLADLALKQLASASLNMAPIPRPGKGKFSPKVSKDDQEELQEKLGLEGINSQDTNEDTEEEI